MPHMMLRWGGLGTVSHTRDIGGKMVGLHRKRKSRNRMTGCGSRGVSGNPKGSPYVLFGKA